MYDNQNQEMAELAIMFFDDPEDETFGNQYLEKGKLDFTIKSLLHVNEYLERVRNDESVEIEWNKVILRCGAYVGEVLRFHSERNLDWIDYQTALKVGNEEVKALPDVIGTAMVLWDKQNMYIFPLAKVEKYLRHGSEDNLHLYAKVLIEEKL